MADDKPPAIRYTVNMDRYVKVEFLKFGYGGETLGRLPDGKTIFVPFALPGETARVEVLEEKQGFVRGRLAELLTPSAERIKPRCPHFAICGGCHYQMISYTLQLEAKQQVLREQLTRLGGMADPPVADFLPSPTEWNYRNSVQFHLDPEGRIGYQAAGSHRVVPIRECHLPEAAINEIWPLLEMEPQPGLERIQLRAGSGEEVLLILENSKGDIPEVEISLPISVVSQGPEQSITLAGEDHLILETRGQRFLVSADSFFQVNTPMAEIMVSRLLDALDLRVSETVMDLYCGVGLFSRFIAPLAGRVIGVEVNLSACKDYAENLDEFDNVELYIGAAGSILPAVEVKADIIVADPPRAGIEKKAMDAILKMKPGTLAYYSCDPATLARDVKVLLAAGYSLESVLPIDMFPQTFHIESLSLFRLA
jgi:23S rRNA (uracil1939-C5)-methyltransferase